MAQRRRFVFLSLAWREALTAARKRRLYFTRTLVAAICFLAIPLQLDFGPTASGRKVFETMSWLAFTYCLFAGVLRSCDTLAEEKREGTLGLLLLTDLRPGSVLLGKFLSASASTFFGLLAIVPMLAIPLMLGGVTKDQFLRVSLNLIVTLFLSLSWGFLISAAARKHLATLLLACFVPLFFGGIWTAIAFIIALDTQSEAIALAVAIVSPALCHFVALESNNAEAVRFYWDCIFANQVIAWGCLLLAARIFPRRAHDTPSDPIAQRREERMRRLRYGDARQRAALRHRLLQHNPLIWFVNRDRIDAIVLTTVCGFFLIIGLLLDASGWALTLAMFTVMIRMAHEASHSISEDQKSGALELLLSTRLSVAEIIKGRVQAIRRRFMAPVVLIVVWTFAIYFLAHETRLKLGVALCAWLLACWLALSWIGPWFALRAKKPIAATLMSLGAVAVPPFGAWFLLNFQDLFAFHIFGGRDHTIAITSCAWVGVVHCFLLIHWSRKMLFTHFREAAADRFATRKFEGVFTTQPAFQYYRPAKSHPGFH